MTKGSKILTTILIILVGVLAGTSGFFYAKTVNLTKGIDTTNIETEDEDPEEDSGGVSDLSESLNTTKTDESKATTSTSTSSSTSPESTTSSTSKATDTTTTSTLKVSDETYTVKSGDTMYSIGLELDLNWLDIAEVNGLTAESANNIKIGQVLKLPE